MHGTIRRFLSADAQKLSGFFHQPDEPQQHDGPDSGHDEAGQHAAAGLGSRKGSPIIRGPVSAVAITPDGRQILSVGAEDRNVWQYR